MFPRRWLPAMAACIAGAAISTCSATAQPAPDSTWWKHAMIYEIYPRSFQDSNGDGIRRPERHPQPFGLPAAARGRHYLDRSHVSLSPG